MRKSLLLAFLLLFTTMPLFSTEGSLQIGVLTDTHIDNRPESLELVKKAFRVFRAQKVDVVAHVGDMAERHSPKGYEYYRESYEEIFAGQRPQDIYVFAAHDTNGISSNGEAFILWRNALKIRQSLYQTFDAKGYPLLVVPQYIDFTMLEEMLHDAAEAYPGKPIFLFDHFPAWNTTDNTIWWGEETRRKILKRYPQVIHISGHVHGTLRNERNIWQGEFTAVNAGGLTTWDGLNPGTTRVSPVDYGVLVMEVKPEEVIFHRFDVRDGKELSPENPWRIPLPFDPASAPYREEARKARQGAPAAFAESEEIRVTPDALPCRQMTVSFPEASIGETVYYYWIDLEKRHDNGTYERIARRGLIGNFHLAAEERPPRLESIFCSSYFEAGAHYRVAVTPEGYFGQFGKTISTEFDMPQTVSNTVVFSCENPMAELPFTNEAQTIRQTPEGDHYLLDDHGMLNLPDVCSNAPVDARFRITVDFRVQSLQPYFWTIAMHCVKPSQDIVWRTTIPLNEYEPQRLCLEFKNSRQNPVHLLFYNGIRGKISFQRVMIERLDE